MIKENAHTVPISQGDIYSHYMQTNLDNDFKEELETHYMNWLKLNIPKNLLKLYQSESRYFLLDN